LAHSVEVRENGELVGGLYGVAIGRMFYGESMFARRTDASRMLLKAHVETSQLEVRKITLHQLQMARRTRD
jgi:Leu/Phe-tRNA-protein transferase